MTLPVGILCQSSPVFLPENLTSHWTWLCRIKLPIRGLSEEDLGIFYINISNAVPRGHSCVLPTGFSLLTTRYAYSKRR